MRWIEYWELEAAPPRFFRPSLTVLCPTNVTDRPFSFSLSSFPLPIFALIKKSWWLYPDFLMILPQLAARRHFLNPAALISSTLKCINLIFIRYYLPLRLNRSRYYKNVQDMRNGSQKNIIKVHKKLVRDETP